MSLLSSLPWRAPDLGLQLWASGEAEAHGGVGGRGVCLFSNRHSCQGEEPLKGSPLGPENDRAHRGRPSPVTPSSRCTRSRLPPPQSLGQAEPPWDPPTPNGRPGTRPEEWEACHEQTRENVAQTHDDPTTP